jgi:hypothetical protein
MMCEPQLLDRQKLFFISIQLVLYVLIGGKACDLLHPSRVHFLVSFHPQCDDDIGSLATEFVDQGPPARGAERPG